MNCTNCGAPLRLVSGRDTLYCEYCTTYHFPDETAEGILFLGIADKLGCPVCRTNLALGSLLGNRLRICPHCRGILANQDSFFTIVSYLRSTTQGPELPVRPLDTTQYDRKLFCPSCERQMDTHPYLGPGNVMIDNCIDCGWVWLDHGEMTRIILTTGRDRDRLFRKYE